jgi:hypothetical protein
MSSITLRPATEDELTSVAQLEAAAFKEDPISMLAFGPRRRSPEAIALRTSSLVKLIKEPAALATTAVQEDGKVVGFALWNFHDEPVSEDGWKKERHWPEGANVELCNNFFSRMGEIHEREMKGKVFAGEFSSRDIPSVCANSGR